MDEDGTRYLTGVNCMADLAYQSFMATKNLYGKAHDTFFYQYVQSFSPQEQILPAEAHGIALELAERFFPDCEVLIATHLDTEHLHSHFIINSVQPNTGKKLHFTPRTLERMRLVSDQICREHGLSTLKPYRQAQGEKRNQDRGVPGRRPGESWKFQLIAAIEDVMKKAGNREDFIREMWLECTATHQIYPVLGSKVVGDITSADNILTDYFRYLTQQEYIPKNPMAAAPMIKKSNFMASQGKEDLPTFETVTIFTPDEITKFKAEAVRTRENGTPIYQQAAAYTLMLNTGLRTGEALGLLNSDIDLENRVIHLQRGVKEVSRREGTESTSGREVKIGKLKSTSSKRDVPLNQAAVDAILNLRAERYFGEDSPLISDEHGGYTRPVNFRKRY